eukprot:CAMPEP_0181394864 /NCGR_PEP_ID=MMETSP1106-20121128/28010_1 /TAXON_ID=81844 /ORGANISM="Mantoniella antarctica, Strain SL-175" /LENGTH=62 /DNA_ID=CAMNT_0023516399 /DNA_START=164 /DNA_END=352 /DNA_ORIENTATION=-
MSLHTSTCLFRAPMLVCDTPRNKYKPASVASRYSSTVMNDPDRFKCVAAALTHEGVVEMYAA